MSGKCPTDKKPARLVTKAIFRVLIGDRPWELEISRKDLQQGERAS